MHKRRHPGRHVQLFANSVLAGRADHETSMSQSGAITTFQWSGVTFYQCPVCPWNNEVEQICIEHVALHRSRERAKYAELPRELQALIYDAEGRPITHINGRSGAAGNKEEEP